MKVIEEIRLDNLLILIKEIGGITRFADRAGKQQAQISQLVNRSPDSKTKKPKAIGSRQAREFEQVAGKELGWMDRDHATSVDATVSASYAAAPPDQEERKLLRYFCKLTPAGRQAVIAVAMQKYEDLAEKQGGTEDGARHPLSRPIAAPRAR